jgi:6-phosphogluconolactonase (cycloisomerase 2 family)
LVLKNNGGDSLAVNADGAFHFASKLPNGSAYDVSVSTAPGNPAQGCRVTLGRGQVASGDVASIVVKCQSAARFLYTANILGGTVTGFAVNPGTGQLVAVPGSPFSTDAATGSQVGPLVPVVTPDGRHLYVVNALSRSLAAFSIDALGTLQWLAGMPMPLAADYWSIVLDPAGNHGYLPSGGGTGLLGGLALDPASGAVAAIPGSPIAVGTGYVVVSFVPATPFVLVLDVNSNAIAIFREDNALGTLTPVAGNRMALAYTPAAVAITPDGRYAYVADPAAHQIHGYHIDAANGTLSAIAGGLVDNGVATSEFAIDPDGLHLYAMNPGNGTISGYALDPASGALTPIAGSPFAAFTGVGAFTFDPAGHYAFACNCSAGAIQAYSVTRSSGALVPLPAVAVGAGTCPNVLLFDPTGRFAYVSDPHAATIWAFAFDPSTGTLLPIPGSPHATGGDYPVAMVFAQ